MSDERRRAMFSRGAEAFGRVVDPDFLVNQGAVGRYVCPICLRHFPESALELHEGQRDLTLEDVPPRSFPGPSSQLALTCRWCNHGAGTRWESDLKTHGDAVKAGRGIGSLHGTLVSGDLSLRGVFHLEDRRLAVRRSSTDPKHFDRFVTKYGQGGTRTPFQFRSGFRYDSDRASFGLVKSAYVLAFARFGYRWVLDPRVAPVRDALADGLSEAPSDLRIPGEMVLSQPGGDLDTRRLIWMTEPLEAFVVVFGANAVVLPHPEGPEDLAASLAGLPKAKDGDFTIDVGAELPWPSRMELSVDFDEVLD